MQKRRTIQTCWSPGMRPGRPAELGQVSAKTHDKNVHEKILQSANSCSPCSIRLSLQVPCLVSGRVAPKQETPYSTGEESFSFSFAAFGDQCAALPYGEDQEPGALRSVSPRLVSLRAQAPRPPALPSSDEGSAASKPELLGRTLRGNQHPPVRHEQHGSVGAKSAGAPFLVRAPTLGIGHPVKEFPPRLQGLPSQCGVIIFFPDGQSDWLTG